MKKILFKKVRFFLSQDRGSVAVLTALLMVVILGFAGLTVDIGIWYSQKRHLQMAADAGAVGGAFALAKTGSTTLDSYVQHDLAKNGCTSATSYCNAVIHSPPTSGPKTGETHSVEVILSTPAQLYFSNFFLGTAPTITARAVAGQTVASNCLLSLGTTGAGLTVKGTSNITSPNCGIQVNSSATNAITTTGGGFIIAHPINVVGGVSGIGTSEPPHTGVGITSDPLASLNVPVPSGCSQTNYTVNGTTTTANPGVYCGGITTKSRANLTLNSGVYYLVSQGGKSGDFTVNAQSMVTSGPGGVTIVLTDKAGGTNYGTVSVAGGATLNLTAMTTGTTAGLIVYGDRNSSGLTQSFQGGDKQQLNGILYFPTGSVKYAGNQATTPNPCFQIIALSISTTGTSQFADGCPLPTGSFGLFQ